MTKLLLVVGVAGALGGLFLFGLLRGRPDRDIPSNLIGRQAPEFTLPLHGSYRSSQGETFSLGANAGRPMIINFWASWCAPCYQEAPELATAWREHGNEVLFVGIQTQDRGRHAEGLEFVNRFGLGFPNVIDDASLVSIDYGLFGVPETFFVDADGVVTYRHIGPVSGAVLEAQIGALTR